ncbi:MAG: AsmA-like C-terminal region-containing protein [Allorhizobium sp.]
MTFLRRAKHAERPEASPTGRRRRRLIKLGVLTLALVAIVSISLRIAAPHLISSAVVRSAIEASMAQWAGHPVVVEDVSELRFWPKPEVTIEGVTVRRAGDRADAPFVKVRRLSAEFSLLSAIKGKPDFNDFEFEQPQIRIKRDAEGRFDWSGDGLLKTAIQDAISGKPASQGGNNETEIGSIEIIDGEVSIADARSGATVVASGISAKLDWPRLTAALSGQATFTVAERSMSMSVTTPTPLLLLGGVASQVDTSVTLPGLRGRSKGIVDLNQPSLDDAELDIRITDVAKASTAMGIRLAGTERWQTASLTAQVTNADDEWRFDELAFEINDSKGDGILTLKKRGDAKPLLGGTVAVSLLNLDDLLQALSIDLGDRANVRLPSLTRWVDVDMRLSANAATFSSFQLADLGASLIGSDSSLKLVIADTRFLGGTLSARLTGSGQGFDNGADIAVMMDRVELSSLLPVLAPAGLSLKGTGSVTLNAKLVGPGWRRNVDAMSGSLSVRADNGQLTGFNAEGLRRLASDRAYFQLSAAGSGAFDYKVFDMSVRFSEGSAEVTNARIQGVRDTLVLSGIIPYSRQALALTGELGQAGTTQQANIPLRFFIGGAWNDPVISPIPTFPPAGQ